MTYRSRLSLILVAAAASATSLCAQLQVSIESTKRQFLAYEPIVVKVRIDNMSGKDMILSGPNPELPWMTFEMTDANGQPVTPSRNVSVKNMIFKAGTSIENQFVINRYYDFTGHGLFVLVAKVHCSDTGEYFSSGRYSYAVTDGKILWEKVVGVPDGQPDAGARRRFMLISYRDTRVNDVYVRIKDEDTNMVYGTIPLGPAVMFGDPQVTTDEKNRLQVLFMTKPRYWRHAIVGADGTIEHSDVYEEAQTTRPTLLTDNSGKVVVRGGFPYRPGNAPGLSGKPLMRLSETPDDVR
jgi:hypothetical protein